MRSRRRKREAWKRMLPFRPLDGLRGLFPLALPPFPLARLYSVSRAFVRGYELSSAEFSPPRSLRYRGEFRRRTLYSSCGNRPYRPWKGREGPWVLWPSLPWGARPFVEPWRGRPKVVFDSEDWNFPPLLFKFSGENQIGFFSSITTGPAR